jgi:hypothetical protein
MTPLSQAIDQLQASQNERHSWLSTAAEQVRHWRAEDAEAGHPWGEDDSLVFVEPISPTGRML